MNRAGPQGAYSLSFQTWTGLPTYSQHLNFRKQELDNGKSWTGYCNLEVSRPVQKLYIVPLYIVWNHRIKILQGFSIIACELRAEGSHSFWRPLLTSLSHWLFPGKVMLSWSRLDVVPSQDLNSCFTYVYFYFRCFKCNHDTISLHPRKVRGDYVVYQSQLILGYSIYTIYVGNYRKWKWCIVFEYCSPFSSEKWLVVKSFKLTRKFQQISGFLLNTSQKCDLSRENVH